MNLYLVERTDRVGWDQLAAIVAAAESEAEARAMLPSGGVGGNGDDPERIVVTLIGVAIDGVEAGVILSDYNAG